MKEQLQNRIRENIQLHQHILDSAEILRSIELAVAACVQALRGGHKILLCGNGGSAADAQHIAAELSGRFQRERAPLFAEALHVNTSALTAISNDYGFEEAFARQVEAMGRKGDVLIAISTSGNSENILRAARKAREIGLVVVGMTGEGTNSLTGLTDINLVVPSTVTARIQEVHILYGHLICEQVENAMFAD